MAHRPCSFSPYRSHTLGHPELQPWESFCLLRVSASLQGSARMVAAFILQAATSCIRFAHAQRSKLIADHDSWLEYECAQGKSRRQGVRPPHSGAPHPLFLKTSICWISCENFMRRWPTLLPIFCGQRSSCSQAELWQVSEDTCFLSTKPISRTRFLECFHGLLIQSGVAPAEACAAQFNRLRRFAPTGALVRLDPQDAQAVRGRQFNFQASEPRASCRCMPGSKCNVAP